MDNPRQNTSAAVPALSPPKEPQEPPELQDLVVVATFQSPVEAEHALSRLQGSGMQAFLRDDITARAQPLWSLALGGVKLAVALEDAEEARMLLEVPVTEAITDAGLEGGEDIPAMSAKDALALRAWRSSVLGFVVPVAFHIYSLFLLAEFVRSPGPSSAAAKRRAALSAVLNAAVLGFGAAVLYQFHLFGR